MNVALHHGDCREIIPTLDAIVDSVVCDPPYHLLHVSRGGSPRNNNPETPFGRTGSSGGFMGQQWDGGDIAFRPETWATIGSVLRPGGFLLAFGGTRTYHRLACAIEDAGFVIQDCLMWLFGTGFPKNKAHLKPAYEPLVLAYKPGGVRTLQIDECRIPIEDNGGRWGKGKSNGACWGPGRTNGGTEPEGKKHTNGRWPANIVLEDCDEVIRLFPESKDGVAGKRSGIRGITTSGLGGYDTVWGGYGSSGSAARFFFSSKAGTQDRWGSRHPTVKPVELMKWLVQLVTPPSVDTLKCVQCGYELPYTDMPRVRPEVSAIARGADRVLGPVSQPNIGAGRSDHQGTGMQGVRQNLPAATECESVLHDRVPRDLLPEAPTAVPSMRRGVPSQAEEWGTPEILLEGVREHSGKNNNRKAVREVRADLSAEEGRQHAVLLPEVCGTMDGRAEKEAGGTPRPEGLCANQGSRASDGKSRRIRDAAPARDGKNDWQESAPERSCASQEWGEGRQSTREPGVNEQEPARRAPKGSTKNNRVPVLRGGSSDIECCPNCGGRYAWTKRPGLVLDPFAGSGTTGVAALATGRNCILIERDDQYIADIRERLAFYEGGGLHSVQAKNRNRTVDHGPLFERGAP